MSRKVYIKKEIYEHTLNTAAEEFYKHYKTADFCGGFASRGILRRIYKKKITGFTIKR